MTDTAREVKDMADRATDPKAIALMQAIREARRERMTQVELARRLDVPQTYISRWEVEYPPRREKVADIERALELPAGTLLRRAGYLDDGEPDIRALIRSDPQLTPDYVQIVLATYEMAVRNSATARKTQSKVGAKGSGRPSTKRPRPQRTRRAN